MTGEILTQAPLLAAVQRAVAYPLRIRRLILLALLGGLAILPYLPVFTQPFVADDYIQIDLARNYGPVAAWEKLIADPLYRCRATSLVMTYWTERLFGTAPLPFYASSVLLHLANTWLVLFVGRRLGMGGVRSCLASAFFAVCLGHQEAVMWYAALPELLLFLFCGCFLLSWNAYLRRGSAWLFGLALACFVLALLSKEAGVVLAPIAAAMAWRRLWAAAPLALLATVYTAAIFGARADHLHFNDGTFSLDAPFAMTWARSILRMFWIWGFLGIAAITFWKRRAWRSLAPAALWIGVAILPFSFLIYMPVIPSRHTYLASAGLGFFVATGLLVTQARFRSHRWVLPVLVAALVAHNTGYIWVKKRQQFLERAAATEDLLKLAKGNDGLIYITCFPYSRWVAEKAIEIKLAQPASRLVWNTPPPPGGMTFCAKDP